MAAEDVCSACGLMRREHRHAGAAYGRCGEFVEGEDGKAWLIFFDDPDRRPEVFAGRGAKATALARFDQLKTSWNIHLFEKVASA